MELGRPWCFAPTTALHLDTNGDVQACCLGRAYPLGNVAASTLRQIWDGDRAVALREAVDRHDLSVGCQPCAWEVETGGAGAIARVFDRIADVADAGWPVSMTFAVSNTCNLRCVMCNGEVSSSIRSQVEHRPPLPDVYGDAFFDELVEFLPHLREADFVGGEPFLARPTLRAMGLLVVHGRDPAVHVNTNGTIWNDQVEALITDLRANVSISVDGITAATFEAIRRGASFPEVMANVDRIHAACTAVDRFTGITHSLMVHNWQELPDLVIWAEQRGLRLVLTKVVDPPEHSLYHLPLEQLAEIVASLRSRERDVERELGGTPAVWSDALDQLEVHLGASRVPFPTRRTAPDPNAPAVPPFAVVAPIDETDRLRAEGHVASTAPGAFAELRADADGTVTDVVTVHSHLDLTEVIGGSLADLLPLLGTEVRDIDQPTDGLLLASIASPDPASSTKVAVVAERDPGGRLTGLRILIAPPS